MAQIQLFGGPQDGYIKQITGTEHPDVFYIAYQLDDEKIKDTRGVRAKALLREKLSTLAYEYDKVARKPGVGQEFQYRRAPKLDKPAPGPDDL